MLKPPTGFFRPRLVNRTVMYITKRHQPVGGVAGLASVWMLYTQHLPALMAGLDDICLAPPWLSCGCPAWSHCLPSGCKCS